jgi:hypothetical protein
MPPTAKGCQLGEIEVNMITLSWKLIKGPPRL